MSDGGSSKQTPASRRKTVQFKKLVRQESRQSSVGGGIRKASRVARAKRRISHKNFAGLIEIERLEKQRLASADNHAAGASEVEAAVEKPPKLKFDGLRRSGTGGLNTPQSKATVRTRYNFLKERISHCGIPAVPKYEVLSPVPTGEARAEGAFTISQNSAFVSIENERGATTAVEGVCFSCKTGFATRQLCGSVYVTADQ
eukprot:456731_1